MTGLDGVCPNGPFGRASDEARAEVERIHAEYSSGGSRAEQTARLLALAENAGWPMTADDARGWVASDCAPVIDADGRLEAISKARVRYLCGCYSWRPALPVTADEASAQTRWAFNPECPVGHTALNGWQITRLQLGSAETVSETARTGTAVDC